MIIFEDIERETWKTGPSVLYLLAEHLVKLAPNKECRVLVKNIMFQVDMMRILENKKDLEGGDLFGKESKG